MAGPYISASVYFEKFSHFVLTSAGDTAQCDDGYNGTRYCETDEVGGWDYCCRPGKRCGYSQNYK